MPKSHHRTSAWKKQKKQGVNHIMGTYLASRWQEAFFFHFTSIARRLLFHPSFPVLFLNRAGFYKQRSILVLESVEQSACGLTPPSQF